MQQLQVEMACWWAWFLQQKHKFFHQDGGGRVHEALEEDPWQCARWSLPLSLKLQLKCWSSGKGAAQWAVHDFNFIPEKKILSYFFACESVMHLLAAQEVSLRLIELRGRHEACLAEIWEGVVKPCLLHPVL